VNSGFWQYGAMGMFAVLCLALVYVWIKHMELPYVCGGGCSERFATEADRQRHQLKCPWHPVGHS
jgi:hypothetical protein